MKDYRFRVHYGVKGVITLLPLRTTVTISDNKEVGITDTRIHDKVREEINEKYPGKEFEVLCVSRMKEFFVKKTLFDKPHGNLDGLYMYGVIRLDEDDLAQCTTEIWFADSDEELKSLIDKAGYETNLTVVDKLGSIQRYE